MGGTFLVLTVHFVLTVNCNFNAGFNSGVMGFMILFGDIAGASIGLFFLVCVYSIINKLYLIDNCIVNSLIYIKLTT